MFPIQPAPRFIDRPIAVQLTDFWHPNTEEENRRNPLFVMLCTRFDLRLSDKPEILLYSRMKRSPHQYAYRCPKVFYSGECDRPRPWQCDLSLTFDPDDGHNVQLPFWRFRTEALAQLFVPCDAVAELAAKTDFCNFVYSNRKAKCRIDFFRRLGQYKKINAGGGVENNIGGRLGGGTLEKMAFLRRHKFTIAFENQSHPGYTTEKMTEALAAKTVPIYWGDPQAAQFFNPQAFINAHAFPSLDALAEYVAQVDQDDALYLRHLKAVCENPIIGGIQRIHDMDNRVFAAFKQLVENPPKPCAAEKPGNKWRVLVSRIRQLLR